MGAAGRKAARERTEKSKARSPVWKAAALAFAVTWLGVLVRWYPLTRFVVWGSDQGEYASLLGTYLNSGGHMPEFYRGWGGAYPDFPGMYVLAGFFSQMSGIDSFLVLSVVIPATAALTSTFAFVLTLRLSGSLRAATMAGALVAVAMPDAFAGSHAMPGALGAMLAMATVTAVVLAPRCPDARWVACAVALALVPTHHLSAFLAGAALAGAALFEARFAPADAARDRILNAALLAACTVVVLSGIMWGVAAPHFRAGVLDRTNGAIGAALPGLGVFAAVALVVATYYLETRPRNPRAYRAIFDERATARRFAIAGGIAIGALGVVATVGVPGTRAVVPAAAAAAFIPLGLVLSAVAAGPGRLAPVRGALVPLGACLGILASMGIGGALLPTVLLPYRHLQYFVSLAAPLCAVALTFAARVAAHWALPDRPALHRPMSVLLLAALVVGASWSTYPSKTALAGFEEGTTMAEIDAVVWIQWDVPITLVATDHRLSSLVYGFANHDATWEASAPILLGDRDTALAALNSTASPSGRTQPPVVLLSNDVVEGAALSQWEPASPLRGAALDKFGAPPFVKIFDNGDAVAFWIGDHP